MRPAIDRMIRELRAAGVQVDMAVERSLSLTEVQRVVAQSYGLHVADLRGVGRHRRVLTARMVAMYLCRDMVGASYPMIGRAFGGKDHTTVINAYRRIPRLLVRDAALADEVAAIRETLARRVHTAEPVAQKKPAGPEGLAGAAVERA